MDKSGGDGVDSDLGAEFPCHGFGKTRHGVLGSDVCGKTVMGGEGSDGSGVDDDSLSLGLHNGGYQLAKVKRTGDINIEHIVPFLKCNIL